MAFSLAACGVEFLEGESRSCEGAVPEPVAAAFARSCASGGCHGGAAPAAGLSLSGSALSLLAQRGSTQSELPLVVFGDVDKSYLALKMRNGGLPAGVVVAGLPMPPGNENSAVAADKATILEWIEQGDASAKCERDADATSTNSLDTSTADSTTDTSQACNGSQRPLVGEIWSAANDIAPIMRARCSGSACHADGGTIAPILDAPGMSLRDALVNVPSASGASAAYVVPGDAARSYLWRKLTNTHASISGGGGLSMPLGQPLCAEEAAMIYGWIVSGAAP
jgi:hypothetical protein